MQCFFFLLCLTCGKGGGKGVGFWEIGVQKYLWRFRDLGDQKRGQRQCGVCNIRRSLPQSGCRWNNCVCQIQSSRKRLKTLFATVNVGVSIVSYPNLDLCQVVLGWHWGSVKTFQASAGPVKQGKSSWIHVLNRQILLFFAFRKFLKPVYVPSYKL